MARSTKSGPKAPAKKAAKPAPKAEADQVDVVQELRKKALVEKAAARAGVNKKTARDVLDAAFAEIGEALSRGEGLNLPPLGKGRVNRQKESGTREVIILKLRRTPKAAREAEQGLAETDD